MRTIVSNVPLLASPHARFVLAVWAGSRAVFLLAGAIAAELLPDAPPGSPPEPQGSLSHWAHWDGAWYSAIATDGYGGSGWPASTNFFPLYPALLRTVALLPGGIALWGVVISVVAGLPALYFVHEIARHEAGERVARSATLALAFFPTSFFLNAVYSEALFLAFAAGSVWAARVRGHLLLAGLLAFAAAATRNVGVLLVIPLAHELLRRRKWSSPLDAVAVLLPVAGLGGYMLTLWRGTGNPFEFATVARTIWGRTPQDPLETATRAWNAAGDGAVWALHPVRIFETTSPNAAYGAAETFNLVFLVLLVVLLFGALSRLPVGLAIYAAIAALVPVLAPAAFSPLASLPRYMLAAFPLFIVAGMGLARTRRIGVAVLGLSAGFGVLLTALFVTGRWVA